MYKTIYLIRDVRFEHIRKIPLSMRLTIVILLIPLFQLSAKGTFGQKVSFRKNNTTLEEVFRVIKIQTGYNVVWSNRRLDGAEPVDVNFRKATVEKVMDEVLKGRAVAYEIIDNAIVIKEGDYPFKKNLEKIISYFTNIDVRGRVVDENNSPLIGALIKVKGAKTTVITDKNGEFLLKNIDDKAVLTISFLGFEPQELKAEKELGNIKMIMSNSKLEEVEVVSTGYQELPKERATGSFTFIDNKTLSRTVSSDILSRLKGVTSGLLTDINANNKLGISVRGRSTLYSNTSPLIVLDNFPFEGDINTINPEMIESVTVLKDAAAAAIWGTLSGNGVIVITSKKGKLNQPAMINIKTDFTIGEKRDLYYAPQLSSSQYIDVERFLYEKGKYNSNFNNDYSLVSPVVAILQKIKKDPSYAAQGESEIDALRDIDYRDQYNKYYFRNSLLQRYFTNINGGSNNHIYSFSMGYDKNQPNSITSTNNRITLRGNNTNYFLKNKLAFNSILSFSRSKDNNDQSNSAYSPFLPYEKLVDENGNAMEVLRSDGLRKSYTDTAGAGRLLDWKYRPIDELDDANSYTKSTKTNYLINLNINYKLIESIKISIDYQYHGENSNNEVSDSKESFYVRNLVNTYSKINNNTKQVTTPFPEGDIYKQTFPTIQSNSIRGQINYDKLFAGKHALSLIAGYEAREVKSKFSSYTSYGYDPLTARSTPMDRFSQFTKYYNSSKSQIGSDPTQTYSLDRSISMYSAGSYIYDNKYIISGSLRKDESNIFGVKANQKGLPQWSTGLTWNIHKESFFNLNWLSNLQLKATYGYNGNVNKSISAYLTAKPSFTNQFSNTIYYELVNPPNDNLRWERVKNINLGISFSGIKNRINGSIEYFIKDGIDLIGESPIAAQSGVLSFIGNTANTHTSGIDLTINTINIDKAFKWNTLYILSYSKDKVTDYKTKSTNNRSILINGFLTPLIGYPINSMFAYPWAGLDKLGNPQGYYNGEISKDYAKIHNSTDFKQLQFFGSRTPLIYGALANNFSYKNFDISFRFLFKFNYYFKRRSIDNGILYNGNFKVADYDLRWKEPGDELITNVPSLIYPSANGNIRDVFYSESAILTEKADHIRIQDIYLSYRISRKNSKKLPFANLNIYGNIQNLGLIWTANKQNLDPEATTVPFPKTFAFGFNATF